MQYAAFLGKVTLPKLEKDLPRAHVAEVEAVLPKTYYEADVAG